MSKILTIDLGGTNTRYIIFDNEYKIVHEEKNKTKQFSNFESFIKYYKNRIKNILDDWKSVEYIAFSIAGPVIDGPIQQRIPGLKNGEYEKSEIINIVKNKKVVIINDANAAAIAEHKMGCKLNDFIYITVSSGVGGGIIKEGKLCGLVGDSEVGYTELKNAKYNASDENFWQDFLGGKKGITNYYNIYSEKEGFNLELTTAKDIFKSKELFVKDFLVDEIGKINAEAITIICNKHNINNIVFGGTEALKNKQVIMSGLKKHLKGNIKIQFTELGDEICALGAAIYINSQEQAPQ